MTRYHLVKVSSSIVEESYEDGEGRNTGCGLNEKIGKTFDSLEELKEHIKDVYVSEELELEGDNSFQTCSQVADHSEAQNGGWMTPTAEEIAQWKKKEIILYLELFTFSFLEVS